MALSEIEKNDYLNQIVLKNFNLLPTDKVCSTVFDTNASVLAMTKKSQLEFGLENIIHILGKTLPKSSAEADILDKDIKLLNNNLQPMYNNAIKDACLKLFKLQQIVIQEKILLSFISLIPRDNKFKSRLINYFPIIHESGEVVAIQSYSSVYNLFGIHEYLDLLQDKPNEPTSIVSTEFNFPIKLTERQHEILFLLSIGLSQAYAAQILGIGRGTLSAIITNYLCPKFNIAGANTKMLVDKAIQMEYHKYMPMSLCKPCIVILDDEIIDKYAL